MENKPERWRGGHAWSFTLKYTCLFIVKGEKGKKTAENHVPVTSEQGQVEARTQELNLCLPDGHQGPDASHHLRPPTMSIRREPESGEDVDLEARLSAC